MKVASRPLRVSFSVPGPPARPRLRPASTPAQAVRQVGNNCALAAVTLALGRQDIWQEVQEAAQGLDGVCEYMEALTGRPAFVHLYEPSNPAYAGDPITYFAEAFAHKLAQRAPVCISTRPRLTQRHWKHDLCVSVGNPAYLLMALAGRVRGGILAEHAYAVVEVRGSDVRLAQAAGNVGPGGGMQQYFWITLEKLLPHVAGMYFLRDA